MPQESQVLRCFSCNMFQAQLVKKEKKWHCKVCNSKQSVKHIYGKGSGKDCRIHVMKLNELQFAGCSTDNFIVDDLTGHDKGDVSINEIASPQKTKMKSKSKWSAFMDEAEAGEDLEEENFFLISGQSENSHLYRKRKRDDDSLCKNEKLLKLGKNLELLKGFEENMEKGALLRKSSKDMMKERLNKKQFALSCEGETSKKGGKWSAFIDEEQDEGESGEVPCIFETHKTDPSTNEMNQLQMLIHDREPSISKVPEQNCQSEILDKGQFSRCTVSGDFKETQLLRCIGPNEGVSIFQAPLNDEELDEILSFEI